MFSITSHYELVLPTSSVFKEAFLRLFVITLQIFLHLADLLGVAIVHEFSVSRLQTYNKLLLDLEL